MKKYQLSPKLHFAVEWLKAHPAHLFCTGRLLEQRIKPSQWKSISYKTWNDAKNLLNTPTVNDADMYEPRRIVIVNFTESTVTYQGRQTRIVRKRSEGAMRRTIDLCKLQGYRVILPVGGVFILTKEFDDVESEAA